MAENYHFRSAINGFNRSDVLAYIDKVLQKKDGDGVGLSELESKLAEAEKKIEELTQKLSDAENNSAAKCAECNIEKVFEARLGAAMLDAKRFAGILIGEADEKVSGLFADAAVTAESIAGNAEGLAENIKEVKDKFNSSFDILIDSMCSVASALDSFRDSVKSAGQDLKFSSDYASETVNDAAARGESNAGEDRSEAVFDFCKEQPSLANSKNASGVTDKIKAEN